MALESLRRSALMKTISGLLLILAFGVFPGPVFSMQETPPAADSTDKEEKKDLPLEATRSLALPPARVPGCPWT
jgi:hypothetical protein